MQQQQLWTGEGNDKNNRSAAWEWHQALNSKGYFLQEIPGHDDNGKRLAGVHGADVFGGKYLRGCYKNALREGGGGV